MPTRIPFMLTLATTISALMSACEGYEYPDFGSVTPNTVDTGQEDTPLEIEGQPWLYTGTIPGEGEAGVTCTQDECERCVLLHDTLVSITFRPIGGTAQDWTSVDYGTYSAAPNSDTGYVVFGRLGWAGTYNWNATSDDGLASSNEGYIVISATPSAASGYTTLGIGLCPE